MERVIIMSLTDIIGSHMKKPRGKFGKFLCLFMSLSNKKMYKETVEAINANESSNILEIGYGSGKTISLLYKKTGANIYGIDISDDMKTSAIKNNQEAQKNGKLHLEIGDCCILKYNSEMFDEVIAINSIYFWDDTLKGLEEIHRVLKKNGCFFNVIYDKKILESLPYTKNNFKLFEISEYEELGKKAGFSDIQIKDIDNKRAYMIKYIK